jgi:transposase
VSRTVADIISAETGADMTAFPTAAHLCSWAGVSPGQHESAGRRKTARTRPGNRHLKAALGTAAMSTTYRRIAARRGKLRAIVAVERAILTAIWHMLSTGTYYQDPGPDYYSRHDRSKGAARALRTLRALGYQVTVHPVAVAN